MCHYASHLSSPLSCYPAPLPSKSCNWVTPKLIFLCFGRYGRYSQCYLRPCIYGHFHCSSLLENSIRGLFELSLPVYTSRANIKPSGLCSGKFVVYPVIMSDEKSFYSGQYGLAQLSKGLLILICGMYGFISVLYLSAIYSAKGTFWSKNKTKPRNAK